MKAWNQDLLKAVHHFIKKIILKEMKDDKKNVPATQSSSQYFLKQIKEEKWPSSKAILYA